MKSGIIYFTPVLILTLGITGCTVKTEKVSTKDAVEIVVESGTEPTTALSPVNPEMESVSETEPPSAAQTLDEAVAETILEQNSSKYPANYEACGEGHIIMDTLKNGNSVTAYVLTMYGAYQFQDENFVKDSGTGVIPAVIQFQKENDDAWTLVNYQEPLDGGLYADSIRSMFPEELWDRCFTRREDDLAELKKQERSYAEAYLKAINRKAVVGDYSDFSHTIPSDVGISTEVSNKIDKARKYADGPLSHAPFWFGTVEKVENGVRYLYEHRYDAEKKELLFSKIIFDTQEIVEQVVFDSHTGELKNQ